MYKYIKSVNEKGNRFPTLSFSLKIINVGPCIYMIGSGCFNNGVDSREVFVFYTLSSNFFQGPSLISGKFSPVLVVGGFKIYALSSKVCNDLGLNPKPRLEVLDTRNVGRGGGGGHWCPLLEPQYPAALDSEDYVDSYAVCKSMIFISSTSTGNYGFDVIDECWMLVSDLPLPFLGEGVYIYGNESGNGDYGSLCFLGNSWKTSYPCIYRIHYVPELKRLSVEEIAMYIVDAPLQQSLEPRTLYDGCMCYVPLGGNRVCLVRGGLISLILKSLLVVVHQFIVMLS